MYTCMIWLEVLFFIGRGGHAYDLVENNHNDASSLSAFAAAVVYDGGDDGGVYGGGVCGGSWVGVCGGSGGGDGDNDDDLGHR